VAHLLGPRHDAPIRAVSEVRAHEQVRRILTDNHRLKRAIHVHNNVLCHTAEAFLFVVIELALNENGPSV
jgi:hypothetical protein